MGLDALAEPVVVLVEVAAMAPIHRRAVAAHGRDGCRIFLPNSSPRHQAGGARHESIVGRRLAAYLPSRPLSIPADAAGRIRQTETLRCVSRNTHSHRRYVAVMRSGKEPPTLIAFYSILS